MKRQQKECEEIEHGPREGDGARELNARTLEIAEAMFAV